MKPSAHVGLTRRHEIQVVSAELQRPREILGASALTGLSVPFPIPWLLSWQAPDFGFTTPIRPLSDSRRFIASGTCFAIVTQRGAPACVSVS